MHVSKSPAELVPESVWRCAWPAHSPARRRPARPGAGSSPGGITAVPIPPGLRGIRRLLRNRRAPHSRRQPHSTSRFQCRRVPRRDDEALVVARSRAGATAVIQCVPQRPDDPQSQPRDGPVQALEVVHRRIPLGGRVVVVDARDHRQNAGTVGGRPREAGRRDRGRCQRDDTAQRYESIRGLEPDDAAPCRGVSDRARRVGAQCAGDHACRDRGARTHAGPAGVPGWIPGITGRSEVVGIDWTISEFGQIRLAEHQSARGAQPLHDGRVTLGNTRADTPSNRLWSARPESRCCP